MGSEAPLVRPEDSEFGEMSTYCDQCEVLYGEEDLEECGSCTALLCGTCRETTRSGWCRECLEAPHRTANYERMRDRGMFDEHS